MPKYSTWHCFSCSNIGSCDCHSLHASKCWHLEMAVASNNAFCPEEIISSRLHCKMRCCTSSLQGRDGDSVWLMSLIWSWKENASLVQASAVHANFTLYFLILYKKKSTLMISSFGFRSSPKIFFPHFSCSLFLKVPVCSISCTHQDRSQPAKSLGMGEMHFSWKMWLAQFSEGVENCGPRGMTLFSSQINQNQTEILAFSRIAIPPLKHASLKTSFWYF